MNEKNVSVTMTETEMGEEVNVEMNGSGREIAHMLAAAIWRLAEGSGAPTLLLAKAIMGEAMLLAHDKGSRCVIEETGMTINSKDVEAALKRMRGEK